MASSTRRTAKVRVKVTTQCVVKFNGVIIARGPKDKCEAYAKRMNKQAPQYEHVVEEQ